MILGNIASVATLILFVFYFIGRIITIAKQKPYYFVMRDSSMANDSVATNFDQIFATYSPDTVRKVL